MTNKLTLLTMGIAAACALAACGSASNNGDNGAQPSAAVSGDSGGGGTPAAQFGPAASGQVAAISGTTMQVQSEQNGQVAVEWTSSTKFRHTVTTTLAAIKVGDCVFAGTASGTPSAATTFTASTLSVTSSSNGTCGADRPGGPGERRSGQRPSGRPSGFPSGQRPSGFPAGGAGRPKIGATANGKVSSVGNSTLVVAGQQRGQTTKKTVKVSATTKISTEAATAAGSVKIGTCVTAQGKADSTGKVTATNVQITEPTGGKCGFGGFGRRGSGG